MDTVRLKSALLKVAYRQMLSFKTFTQLWETYKGSKAMLQKGYPLIVRNRVIFDETEAEAFIEALVEELLLRLSKENKQHSRKQTDSQSKETDNDDFPYEFI